MIKNNKNTFIIETKSLSYIFHVNEMGILLHDYFGMHIDLVNEDTLPISLHAKCQKGTTVIYDDSVDKEFSLDTALLEFSFPHKGDFKESQILFKNDKYGFVFDFKYDSFEIKSPGKLKELPTPHGASEELVINLKDEKANIVVELHYLVFEDSDVIARNIVIKNLASEVLTINRALSLSLDFINKNYELITLAGGWISEANVITNELKQGMYSVSSLTGASSHHHNPFFALKEKGAGLDYGEALECNLMYSGNHLEQIYLSNYDKVRILTGINPFCFEIKLATNEVFETPYAVLTFSNKGINGASQNMHHFVNNHVIKEQWKDYLRPVVINNWEATYFKFTERKLISLAKQATKFGAELFVLDDGWFSSRNDDYHGLGDYFVNKKKLPHGLNGLAKRINKLGLKFGLWFEPESVNIDSELYKAHPDWAVHNLDRIPSKGRHQLVLDLSKKEVQDYIIKSVDEVLKSANIEYVKWDMNRHISDIPSLNPGTFYHEYILGLYRILDYLTNEHPNILFEGCSNGGNRFDLGMLAYFPQIWTSDDTDPVERIRIQSGYALAYPLSSISNHISCSPSHQLLRRTTLDTRFNVASFGILGYELLFKEMEPLEKKRLPELIKIYKENRDTFQHGVFSQSNFLDGHNEVSWNVTSVDGSKSFTMLFNLLQSSHPVDNYLYVRNVCDEFRYNVSTVQQKHDIRKFGSLVNMILPIHVNPNGAIVRIASKHVTINGEKEQYVVSGNTLNNNAVILDSQWSGSGLNDDVRVMGDFGSRLYIISKENEAN